MAARSLHKSLRVSLVAGLFVLAVVACSSSNFSASGGSSGDAGEAGDDSSAGSSNAGRAGASNRAGAGGTSPSAGRAGNGEEAGEAGEGSVAGSSGTGQGGSSVGGGAPSAGAAGLGGTAGSGVSGGGGSNVGGSSGAPQAGAPGAGSGGACTTPTTYYADDDRDEFGRSTSTVKACSEPIIGTWALKGGDCNDDNKLVYPLAASYRGTGYAVTGGTSFDYDCSAQEDPDPTQLGLAPACPGSFLNCAGTGFKSTGRTGAGVNPICGSTIVITCTVDGLGCKAAETTVPASRCR